MSAIRSASATARERGFDARPVRRLRQPTVGTAIKRAKPTWEKPYQRRLVISDGLILIGTLAATQAVWIGIDTHQLVSAGEHGVNQVPYWVASLVLLAGWLVI